MTSSTSPTPNSPNAAAGSRTCCARWVFPGASASSPCSAGYPSLALPLVLLLWRDADVAVAVSVALFAASSIATLIAVALPSILQRLRKRPALRLQALATVVQDLLSVGI